MMGIDRSAGFPARDLLRHGYVADEELATVLRLALDLRRPLLLEGEPGVGKTEVARALAAALERRLLRLQCYEGIGAAEALYDWDHARQLLYLRTANGGDASLDELYGPEFLLARPLLAAISSEDAAPPVLLIDEVDRADDEFEAFTLELLADFQLTIPEIGTIAAARPPIVILTSNRTRELSQALRRRCLYHWLDHPDSRREIEILRLRVPEAPEPLARQVASQVAAIRKLDLVRPPGVAESIDWLAALVSLGVRSLDAEQPSAALGALLKHREDIERVREKAP